MSRGVVVLTRGSRREHSKRSAVDCSGPTKTQQQFKDAADINTIMRRFGVTGVLPSVPGKGWYGDFTGISDVRDAFDVVERAQARFMALDPAVRERFRNDPRELERYARSVDEETFYRSFDPPEVSRVAPTSPGAVPAGAGAPVPPPAGGGLVPPVAGAQG